MTYVVDTLNRAMDAALTMHCRRIAVAIARRPLFHDDD
jgi:hypothetical protein